MTDLPEPHFVDRDPAQIRREVRERCEELVGRALEPGQIESLYCDLLAYRETLVRVAVQAACRQNLLAYALYPMIDYLGQFLGAERLPAQPARTTLRFTLPEARGVDSPVPLATRVRSRDRKVEFETAEDLLIPEGETDGEVTAVCRTVGPIGNAYIAGQVNELLSTLDFEVAVENITETLGGSAQEETEAYRQRIPLEAVGSSVAGPELAYVRLARSAHPDVLDVAPLSPEPGLVQLAVLTRTGTASPELLELIEETCSARDKRPLTDTVEAVEAEAVDYTVEVEIVLYQAPAAAVATIVQQATEQVEAYVASLQQRLGRSPVESTLQGRAQVPGVYSATVTTELPSIEQGQWPRATEVAVVHVGFTEEEPA